MQVFLDPKDPDDIDDFGFDWRRRLVTGETIAAFTPAVVAGDAVIDDSDISGTVTIARLSAGTDGTTAEVRFRITTSAGRQLDETGRISVRTT